MTYDKIGLPINLCVPGSKCFPDVMERPQDAERLQNSQQLETPHHVTTSGGTRSIREKKKGGKSAKVSVRKETNLSLSHNTVTQKATEPPIPVLNLLSEEKNQQPLQNEAPQRPKQIRRTSKYNVADQTDLSTIPEHPSNSTYGLSKVKALALDGAEESDLHDTIRPKMDAHISRDDPPAEFLAMHNSPPSEASIRGTWPRWLYLKGIVKNELDEHGEAQARQETEQIDFDLYNDFNPLSPHVRKPSIASGLAAVGKSHENSILLLTSYTEKKQGTSRELATSAWAAHALLDINTQNCRYYIGRRNPGPGDAPPEDRQIGFKPV